MGRQIISGYGSRAYQLFESSSLKFWDLFDYFKLYFQNRLDKTVDCLSVF